MTAIHVIILAAGQGKRMQSVLPKVLHPLAGVPLLERVVNTAKLLSPAAIHIVYGHGGDQVRQQLSHLPINWIEQAERLGTGHAVTQAISDIPDTALVVVLYGDVPLISAATLQQLIQHVPFQGIGVITVAMPNPTGFGRILRNANGQVMGIVEEKDADSQQRQIKEIYSGILAAPASQLKTWLPQLKNNNAQQEYYLTDIIRLAVTAGFPIADIPAASIEEVQGVNDRVQLAQLERSYQQRLANQLMLSGVSLLDPARIDIRGNLDIGQDSSVDINVIFEGTVQLGKNTVIGPHCILRNVRAGDNIHIKANSIIEDADIADGCIIGPFARIRPGTRLSRGAHIGNFVEIKKSQIGENSKVNHLSYLGDATVGRDVNIGAGTITCNYDGVNKHQTIIGDRAFIGSDSQLVAPVTVGAGATIGAGSTITKNAPAETLTISRAKQTTITGWQRPIKKETK